MKRRDGGRYLVKGPDTEKYVGSRLAALAAAQGIASRHGADGDWTVREIGKPRPLYTVQRRGRVVGTQQGGAR